MPHVPIATWTVISFTFHFIFIYQQYGDNKMKKKENIQNDGQPAMWNARFFIACSRRRHGQEEEKTLLSCLVRVGGVNRIGDKTRQFCLVSTLDLSTQLPVWNCSVSNILRITENLEIGNWVKTRQNCLVLSPIVFTPPTRTRKGGLVLSVSAVWTSY